MKIHLFDQDESAISVAAGQVIFRVGAPTDLMYAVISGRVEIVIHDQVVETVEAGGIFGEMALIEDRPRNATATVIADARLVAIDRKRFLFLVQQNPYFSIQLMTIMAGRLRRMDERL